MAWADCRGRPGREREVDGERKVQQQTGGHAQERQRQGDDVRERSESVTLADVPYSVAIVILVQQPAVPGRAAPQEIEADGNDDQRSVVDGRRRHLTSTPEILGDQCRRERQDTDPKEKKDVVEEQPIITAGDV